MFLSIIIPVYNAEKFLAECLDSCLDQDIPHDEYEIVCVNDGSKDNSLEVLHSYADKYSNIVVLDQENGGVCSARNAGLKQAKGDYIWLVDSDDLVQPNILREMKAATEGSRCDRLHMEVYTFSELSEKERKECADGTLKSNSKYYDNSSCDSLLKRDYLLKNDLYFKYPDIAYNEDNIFMFEFRIYNPVEADFDRVGYYYRQQTDSAMHSKFSTKRDKNFASLLHCAKIMKEYCDNLVGDARNAANMLMRYIWGMVYMIADLPLFKACGELKKLHRQGLFPIKRYEACSLKKSYETTRTDFVGKTFDWLYIHSNRIYGFLGMYLFKRLQNLNEKLKK